jgi:hypothetical protein
VLPDVPDVLPGEDRTFGAGLFVDLGPSTCWHTDTRSWLCPRDRERLRRMAARRAGMSCEVCGRGEELSVRRSLEAHERWDYDLATGVQTLRRLICLCSDCHLATHFGPHRASRAFTHLRTVTGMSVEEANQHLTTAFELGRQRSARHWTVDLGVLAEAGVDHIPCSAEIDPEIDAEVDSEAPTEGLTLAPVPSSAPSATPPSQQAGADTAKSGLIAALGSFLTQLFSRSPRKS